MLVAGNDFSLMKGGEHLWTPQHCFQKNWWYSEGEGLGFRVGKIFFASFQFHYVASPAWQHLASFHFWLGCPMAWMYAHDIRLHGADVLYMILPLCRDSLPFVRRMAANARMNTWATYPTVRRSGIVQKPFYYTAYIPVYSQLELIGADWDPKMWAQYWWLVLSFWPLSPQPPAHFLGIFLYLNFGKVALWFKLLTIMYT